MPTAPLLGPYRDQIARPRPPSYWAARARRGAWLALRLLAFGLGGLGRLLGRGLLGLGYVVGCVAVGVFFGSPRRR